MFFEFHVFIGLATRRQMRMKRSCSSWRAFWHSLYPLWGELGREILYTTTSWKRLLRLRLYKNWEKLLYTTPSGWWWWWWWWWWWCIDSVFRVTDFKCAKRFCPQRFVTVEEPAQTETIKSKQHTIDTTKPDEVMYHNASSGAMWVRQTALTRYYEQTSVCNQMTGRKQCVIINALMSLCGASKHTRLHSTCSTTGVSIWPNHGYNSGATTCLKLLV